MLKKIPKGFSGFIQHKSGFQKPQDPLQRPQGRPVYHDDRREEDVNNEARAREILLEAKDEALRIREEARREASKIDEKRDELIARLQEVHEQRQKLLKNLEALASLTKDEARKLMLEEMEHELKEDMAKKIRQAEEEAKATADKNAREILVEAMYHGATDYVPEQTTSTVRLPDEEMKGRIIGKEGRNIRTLEQTTGVDVDVDETPGEIRLSSFDPVRREIAKRALEQLMADGRIQPSRIEEVVGKTRDEIEKIMQEEGERLCHDLGVYNLPSELMAMLGRFKYRFSYGQNMIVHTMEETKIGVALAEEIGADVNIVRLGALLHDIGKIVTEDEGTHVEKGVALLKKHRLPQAVIDCVAQHHEDEVFTSVESILVYIADAISGSRPGARHEAIEAYIKRMGDLEEIAASFDGVDKAFTLQAGREVRVFFKSDEVDDAAMDVLVHKIAKKIETDVQYPGVVKVVGIRESRVEAKAA